MGAFAWLSQLHLVTQKHNVLGAQSHRHQICQCHLPCLIHEEVIERFAHLLARKEPRSASDQLRAAVENVRVILYTDDGTPVKPGVAPGSRFFHSSKFAPLLASPLLHSFKQMVD